jgi:hypothetical protein
MMTMMLNELVVAVVGGVGGARGGGGGPVDRRLVDFWVGQN